jgi:hypothetical protein
MKVNKIAVFLSFFVVVFFTSVKAQNIDNYYREAIGKIPSDSNTAEYLTGLANTDKPQLNLAGNLELNGFDLIVSLICLALALLIPIHKNVSVKGFLWFFISINVFWLFSQLLMRGGWRVMDYFVLRLQPAYLPGVTQAFYYISIFLGLGIFNWLIARNFGTGFFGAIKIMFLANFIYFVFAGVLLVFVPWQNDYVSLAKNNLGMTQALSGYLWDVRAISEGKGVIPSLRFRSFHL